MFSIHGEWPWGQLMQIASIVDKSRFEYAIAFRINELKLVQSREIVSFIMWDIVYHALHERAEFCVVKIVFPYTCVWILPCVIQLVCAGCACADWTLLTFTELDACGS